MASTSMSKDKPKASQKPGGGVPVPKMKRGFRGFYRDLVREMKHVTWPTVGETNRLTGVVLGVCIFIILLLFGLSYVFDMLLKPLIGGGAG